MGVDFKARKVGGSGLRVSRMAARKPDRPLRRGWTTGACATAAAAAAFRALETGTFADDITITLPKGQEPCFVLARKELADGHARAGIVKDAGDDPDVTHGAEIVVTVRRGAAGSGVTYRAGDGVGTVTLAGLPVPPGEPAINPGPRRMIESALKGVAEELGVGCDVEVEIAIPGGAALAEKTMNPRLGIKGGLSILGTTGVVIPYSCASWIHSIHRGVDVARGLGLGHLLAATGKTSEAAVRAAYPDASEQAVIDMGDFAGGLLKYLREHPVGRLTLAGGFAKLAKLGQGNLDLHSARSSLDLARLAETARQAGADAATAKVVAEANTGMEALDACRAADVPLGDAVARLARETAVATAGGGVDIEVMVFDRGGERIGHAGFRA